MRDIKNREVHELSYSLTRFVDSNSCWGKARISIQIQEVLLTIQPSHAI
nr:unnamed protein product [Callosobruchus chinensis]